MATSADYQQFICDCLSHVGHITTRKMMGEYCIYLDGKLIGEICDDRFLVKQTETSKRLLADCALEYPYEGSKTLMFVVEEVENRELMEELLRGLYAELPAPKRKK